MYVPMDVDFNLGDKFYLMVPVDVDYNLGDKVYLMVPMDVDYNLGDISSKNRDFSNSMHDAVGTLEEGSQGEMD
uniref:Uncharacterized protein n=1 Tax=Timema douglasi TaxID=61478 RepID=A0A7R8VR09_TIMDO|nr:unnamed protein product [Timema douglasi]